MNTSRILEDIDKHASEFNFPVLDNAYVELAAARLTAFRSDQDWLICFEVQGFSTREAAFVDDLYAYGSCIDKGGYFSELVTVTSAEEQPLFDVETNECIADWTGWTVKVLGRKMSFSPTPEEYRQAGITVDDRGPGPRSLKEIELLRFLVNRLGAERLFVSDEILLRHFPDAGSCQSFFRLVNGSIQMCLAARNRPTM